jgi:hypothetical protein
LLPRKPVLDALCQWAAELYYAPAAETYEVMVTGLGRILIVAAVAVKLMLLHQTHLLEQPEIAVDC